MSIKVKLKPCSGCGEMKMIWKNIGREKFCRECYYGKSKTGVAKKPKPTAKRIPVMSSKMEKKKAAYTVLRIKFLMDHPMCELHHPGICLQKATEVHHTEGRIEELLLDSTKWKAACRMCHNWAEMHPEEAKELGYSSNRLTDEKT